MSTEQEEHDLVTLKMIRETCRDQIMVIETWLDARGYNEFDVDAKLKMLDSSYELFIQTQDQIEMVEDGEIGVLDTVDNKACELKARVKRMKFHQAKKSYDPSKAHAIVQCPTEVTLPKRSPHDGNDYLEGKWESSESVVAAAVESLAPSKVRVEVHAPIEVSMPKLLPYDGDNDLECPNFLTSSKALVDHSQSYDLTKHKYGFLQVNNPGQNPTSS